MADDEFWSEIATLVELERQLLERFGRGGELLMCDLSLDYECRVAELRRLLGTDPTDADAGRTDR